MIIHGHYSDYAIQVMIIKRMINYGGNHRYKIYGQLRCTSGKRMKRENRVFFYSAAEAIKEGYRPCGRCCRAEFLIWKEPLAIVKPAYGQR